MKRILLAFFFFTLFFSQQGKTQSWDKAIGLRLGFPNSITYKQFISEKAAIEANLGIRNIGFFRSVNLSAAYQIHNILLEDSFGGLRWYYGGGATVVRSSFRNSLVGIGGSAGDSNITLGIQGYLGVDYTFEDVPINISLDWTPAYLIGDFNDGFGGDGGALAIRYIF